MNVDLPVDFTGLGSLLFFLTIHVNRAQGFISFFSRKNHGLIIIR